MTIKLSLAALATLFAISAQAAEPPKPEQLIKWRQAGYNFMAWNMNKLKAQLENPATADKAQVAAAAAAIAGIAGSGMGALYPESTKTGTGFKPTEVKPEFFAQPEEVKKVAVAFGAAAGELNKVAATGDMGAAKAALGKLNDTCKGCHDKFKKKD